MSEDYYSEGIPSRLELHPGGEARVTLRSAAGAGYQWQAGLLRGDPAAADVRIELGPPPRQTDPPSNQPSPVALVVRANRIGNARWTIKLVRSWQPDSPLVEHELEIDVRT